MARDYRVLFEENNIISLRTASVFDNEDIAALQLMPAWLESSIPPKKGSPSANSGWISQDQCYLYRHLRTADAEARIASGTACVEQRLRPIRFESPPQFRCVWTESGNSVLLYINGEPWALIDEASHNGFSKGIIPRLGTGPWEPATPQLQWEAKVRERILGKAKPWDQELFDKILPTLV